MTERDRQLISLVALHGAASRKQLMAVGFFGSVSRANRRLKQLAESKFLRRAHLATNGTIETIYLLGVAGVSIVAELALIDRIELQRQAARQPQRAYLEHQLGVVDLRVALTMANLPVTRFLTEPECRHEYEVVTGCRTQRRIIKPDGYFAVALGARERGFFLEFDRGHCSIPQMRGVFKRYGRYESDGAFREVYGLEAFEVLVITTAGARRIAHLAAAAGIDGATVRFTTQAQIQMQGFFGRIWRGPEEQAELLLQDQEGAGP